MTYHISFDWVLAFDTTEMVCWRRVQRLDYYWCWWNVCVAAVSRSMWIPPNRDHCSRPMCSNRRHCRRNSNRIHGQPRNWLRVCDRIRRRCRRHLAVSLHSPMPHRSCKRPLFASSNAAGQKNWVFFSAAAIACWLGGRLEITVTCIYGTSFNTDSRMLKISLDMLIGAIFRPFLFYHTNTRKTQNWIYKSILDCT